jgi:tRNA A37 N6-isopentenylltransferase MiaA
VGNAGRRLPAKELRDRGIYATRQFAKRQLTWLRSMDGLHRSSIRWHAPARP